MLLRYGQVRPAAFFLGGAVTLSASTIAQSSFGTPEQRVELLRSVIDKTLRWEAFSPPKSEALGIDFAAQANQLEPLFAVADSDNALFAAFVRLSDLRCDAHLSVETVPGGLRPDLSATELPIRFAVRFAGAVPELAVRSRALGTDSIAGLPPRGARVLTIDGRAPADFLADFAPCGGSSTRAQQWWRLATELSLRRRLFGGARDLTFRFDTGTEDVCRAVRLQFRERALNRWAEEDRVDGYPGFELEQERSSYRLHRNVRGEPVILLEWRGFGRSLEGDLDALVQLCSNRGWQSHDVILDLRNSAGGKHGARLLRRLVGRPFVLTSRNLRLDTELFERFRRRQQRRRDVSEARLRWLDGPVAQALAQGERFAPPLPYTDESARDGVIHPAGLRLHGNLVCLLGLPAGSQVDQVAAMVVDNGLGHTIGRPCGGFSNAWEWSETLRLTDGTRGRPLVRFRWSIGQTLRPNGTVLEGNPAMPSELVPSVDMNGMRDRAELVRRALQHLRRERTARPR